MSEYDVSRETLEKLKDLEALVKKWSPKINLVSRSSLVDLWERHIIDSAQLAHQEFENSRWVDLGSGSGFPALVISILHPDHQMTLVESDRRKCAFLRTAARELSLRVTVHPARIEELPPLYAEILSARALAELDVLLGYANKHLLPSGTALFMKGENWKKEVEVARRKWSFSFDVVQSVTDSRAVILKTTNIKRK